MPLNPNEPSRENINGTMSRRLKSVIKKRHKTKVRNDDRQVWKSDQEGALTKLPNLEDESEEDRSKPSGKGGSRICLTEEGPGKELSDNKLDEPDNLNLPRANGECDSDLDAQTVSSFWKAEEEEDREREKDMMMDEYSSIISSNSFSSSRNLSREALSDVDRRWNNRDHRDPRVPKAGPVPDRVKQRPELLENSSRGDFEGFSTPVIHRPRRVLEPRGKFKLPTQGELDRKISVRGREDREEVTIKLEINIDPSLVRVLRHQEGRRTAGGPRLRRSLRKRFRPTISAPVDTKQSSGLTHALMESDLGIPLMLAGMILIFFSAFVIGFGICALLGYFILSQKINKIPSVA